MWVSVLSELASTGGLWEERVFPKNDKGFELDIFCRELKGLGMCSSSAPGPPKNVPPGLRSPFK